MIAFIAKHKEGQVEGIKEELARDKTNFAIFDYLRMTQKYEKLDDLQRQKLRDLLYGKLDVQVENGVTYVTNMSKSPEKRTVTITELFHVTADGQIILDFPKSETTDLEEYIRRSRISK
ncbi:MAG: hypothetical protein ABII22_02580 [Candidatus Micrarchaeota archaeon]